MSTYRRLMQSCTARRRAAEAQAEAARLAAFEAAARRERYLAALAAELKGAAHA